jgi:CheY-like chemotaxis protein
MEEETENSNETNWSRIWRDFWITACFIVASNLLGFIFILLQPSGNRVTAALWALSCLASGGIVGFLFGIPRVLQDDNAPNAEVNENEENKDPANTSKPFYRMQVNTNLEQISDWLTKIIVGVGLIEMRRIPELLNSLSGFLAAGLGERSAETQTLAAAIIVYFVVVGFLGGYLITRIYLAQAFSRADWGTQNTVTVGGRKLTITEIVKQQGKIISDVQNAMIKTQNEAESDPSHKTTEEKSISAIKTPVRTILWVDDNPKSNSVHVDNLNKLGIDVVSSLSTEDALKQFNNRTFDRIISDMGRRERGNVKNERAGIDLTKAIRKLDKNIPIIIFCATKSVVNFKEEAIKAGANEVTSSSTILMMALHIEG